MTTDDKTPMLKAAVAAVSQAIRQALDGPSVATGRPPRADAGASLVSGEYDEAAAHHDALLRQVEQARAENARLRSQLAEARQERDQAAEALAAAESERDAARDAQVQYATAMAAIDAEIIDDLRAVLALSPGQSLTRAVTQLRDDLAWLRRQVLAVAEDLERYASDLRPERLPMSERKLAWTLRQIVAGERPEACRCGKPAGHCSHCHDDPPAQTVADALDDAVGHLRDMLLRAIATTAPETGPTAPQTDEQGQVRGESHTKPQTGSQRPLDLDAIRAAWLRVCGSCDAGYPTACTCPPGDSRTVIAALVAEIDRLRAEAAMLRAEVERAREIAHSYRHEIGAAQVFDVLEAALGTTPDTGSTT